MGNLKKFIMTTTGVFFIFSFVFLAILGFYNAYQEGREEDKNKDQQQSIEIK